MSTGGPVEAPPQRRLLRLELDGFEHSDILHSTDGTTSRGSTTATATERR